MTNAEFDPFRFLDAQEAIYANVLNELNSGQKRSHWMWFIFPQLAALGRSPTARFYGLEGAADARAFHQHSILGPRLLECSALVLAVKNRTANHILGSPDDLKLCSCMTLFNFAVPHEAIYESVLQHFYKGAPDRLTLELLQAGE